MIDLFTIIAGQVIGVLLWSLLLNAPILQSRARKLKNWSINYKNAYFVSIKAGLVALIIGDATVFTIALSGNTNEELLKLIALIIGLASWWFAHSNALLKLAEPSGMLSIKDARSISTSVLVYLIGWLFVLSVGLMLMLATLGLLSFIK